MSRLRRAYDWLAIRPLVAWPVLIAFTLVAFLSTVGITCAGTSWCTAGPSLFTVPSHAPHSPRPAPPPLITSAPVFAPGGHTPSAAAPGTRQQLPAAPAPQPQLTAAPSPTWLGGTPAPSSSAPAPPSSAPPTQPPPPSSPPTTPPPTTPPPSSPPASSPPPSTAPATEPASTTASP